MENQKLREFGSGAASTAGAAHRILIVEGDTKSADTLRSRLATAGFAVTTLNRGEDAVAAVDRESPHLVMLDWDLPGVVTMSLLKHVCKSSSRDRTPRLMAMSTYAGEQQVVAGLEQGLDDYVIKPYSILEVIARVRALLRPIRSVEVGDRLEFRRLVMDLAEARVTVLEHRVRLRNAEFRLLEFLMRHPERAFGREQLLNSAWGRDCPADGRAVDVTIQRLRKALEPHDWGGDLQTIRGLGYRLSATREPGSDA